MIKVAEHKEALVTIEAELNTISKEIKDFKTFKKGMKVIQVNQEKLNELLERETQSKNKVKEAKKIYVDALKQFETAKENEIKALIKQRFDYQIPIAEVEKAGISTTGSVIENELEPLEEEFTAYRKANKLWENTIENVKYEIIDENIFRMVAGEPETFYGK